MSKLLSITQMSRTRYRELCTGWIDGSLLKKWEGKKALTKADKTEEAQIRMIGLLFRSETPAGERTRATLRGDKWSRVEFFRNADNEDECTVQVRA